MISLTKQSAVIVLRPVASMVSTAQSTSKSNLKKNPTDPLTSHEKQVLIKQDNGVNRSKTKF